MTDKVKAVLVPLSQAFKEYKKSLPAKNGDELKASIRPFVINLTNDRQAKK